MASAGIRKTPTGRYKVWWRLDDGSQGSQTFTARDAGRVLLPEPPTDQGP